MKHILSFLRRRWLLLLTVLLPCLLCLVLGGLRSAVTDRADQQAADRWSGDDTRFAQVSLYTSAAKPLSVRDVLARRSQIDERLVGESLTPASDSARLWLDAYSAAAIGSAETDRGSATVNITACGGDYFYFHPEEFLSGSGFSEADEQHDTIVLDELAAWQLFGSPDVTGRPVELNGRVYTVSGVTAVPQDKASLLTRGDKPRVWVFYDTMYKPEEAAVTCYEILLPDPYSGYAEKVVKEVFGFTPDEAILVENSSRYRIPGLWKSLRTLTRAGLRTSDAVCPWWENAALYSQNRAALLLGGQVLLLLWPALAACIGLVWCWRHRRWHLRDLARPFQKAAEKRRVAAWEAAQHPDGLGEPD